MSSSRLHTIFTGRADSLGNFRCVDGVVHFHATAEAAAQERGMHFDLLRLESRRARDHVRNQLLELGRGDDDRLVRRTSAVVFCGSIGECDRNGSW